MTLTFYLLTLYQQHFVCHFIKLRTTYCVPLLLLLPVLRIMYYYNYYYMKYHTTA